MEKVSVIVPVYNVESYISECIESLINQTYKNLEIILINDGSTDKSLEICNNYANIDSRIKVLTKKNGGGARGAVIKGVYSATGKFVAFLDSDDVYKLDAVENMVKNIIEYQADCVQFNYSYLYNGIEKILTKRNFEILEKEDIQKILHGFFEDKNFTSQFNHGRTDRIYSYEILKKVVPELNEEITIYEDIEMSLHTLMHANRIVILPESYWYVWRTVENSISRRFNDNTILEHTKFLNEVDIFAKNNNFEGTNLTNFKDKIYADLIVQSLITKNKLAKKINYQKELISKIKDRTAIKVLAEKNSILTKMLLLSIYYFNLSLIPNFLANLYLWWNRQNK